MAETGPWDLPLEAGCSLAVWHGEALVFGSGGKWLHPLFELSSFLDARPDLDRSRISIRDRVAGRAAAWLYRSMGIVRGVIELGSQGAVEILEQAGIPVHSGQAAPLAAPLAAPGLALPSPGGAGFKVLTLVPAIGCMTEAALASMSTQEEVMDFLAGRLRASASRVPGRPG